MTKPTFASVTEEPCKCGYLEEAANEPGSPIVFDAELNEYHFEYPSPCAGGTCDDAKATMMIYHCPFCGGAAPASKRDLLFAVIPPEEERRLYELIRGIRTLEEAIRVLGPPDLDDPRGVTMKQPEQQGMAPTVQSYRALTYSRLSDTAEVVVTDYRKDGVQFMLRGKYVGAPVEQASSSPEPPLPVSETDKPGAESSCASTAPAEHPPVNRLYPAYVTTERGGGPRLAVSGERIVVVLGEDEMGHPLELSIVLKKPSAKSKQLIVYAIREPLDLQDWTHFPELTVEPSPATNVVTLSVKYRPISTDGGEPAEKAIADKGSEPVCCVCCHKDHEEVGPFAEVADKVYICNPCVGLCAAIIEQECRRLGMPLKEYHE